MSQPRIAAPSGALAGRGLETVTRWVLAHKGMVAIFWIVLTVAGFYGSSKVTDRLDEQFSMPSSPAYAVNQEIAERFGGGGEATPLVAVATLPASGNARDPQVRSDLRQVEHELTAALPGTRVASYGSTGEAAYVSDDGRTTFVLAYPPIEQGEGPGAEISPETVEAARGALAEAKVGGSEVLLTGRAALEDEPVAEEGGGDSSFLNETLIAGVAALVVLIFVFASALAVVPLLMAVVAIPVTLLAVLGLTTVTDVSFIVLFLCSLIGLGLAIDYALIVVMRWREERERGLENEEAILAASRTAGHAVLFSGTTVAIGLLAAVVLPIPFLRSMAYGGLLIPLVSVAVALTLLPVVLSKFGPRADRRRLRRTDRAEQHWASWARFVIRHRVLAVVLSLALLLGLCGVASGMLLGDPAAKSMGGSGEAQAGLVALERSGIGAAPLTPIEATAPSGEAAGVARELAQVEGVRAASAPSAWSEDGRALIDVFPSTDTASSEGRDTVAAVREAAAELPDVGVGGATAMVEDWVQEVYGSFPLMLALIALITFVLLVRAFRSVVLPLKAVLMNLISVFATWGVMTLVWQHGFGTELLLGSEPTGSIAFWAPLLVFAFIYGLSMDYEVFILSRVREEYERTGSTDEAVVRGIASTGRLVTSAALIVFLAFASMATTDEIDVQMLATGLAAGVLLDALVVRSLLVPATVSWLGRWNWWMPGPLRRLLRIPEIPPASAEPVGERV